jgi:hypothetical protein
MYRTSLLVSLLFATACGGSTPPAEAPEGAEAPAKKSAKADAKDADDKADKDKAGDTDKDGDDAKPAKEDKSDAKKDKADKADAKKDDAKKDDASGPKSGRTPRDVMAAPDVVWVFNFNDSDVKQAAEEKCQAKDKDPKKVNACMAAAHKAVEVDGYRFVEKDGKLWWVTLKISGKKITNMHKFEVDFVEKDHAAVVKPKGKDMGQAPGRTPADLTFDVPNEYQITIKDARLGKLAYDAKIGLVSNEDASGAAGKAKR